jgi:hypothetical protein
MRLTIAATLLTQAIPAASSSQSKNVELSPLQKNNLYMSRLQARRNKRRGKQVPDIERSLLLEDPFSIESIRLANSNKPREVGAPLLKNFKKVECDPSSQGLLDVGILSCGVAGQYSCQASEESLLGGFCVIEAEAASSVSSRILAEPEDYVGIYCDKDNAEYKGNNCDCKDIDENTKTGTISCLPYVNCCFDAGDDSFCGSATDEFFLVDGIPTGSTTCYSFTSPYIRTACVTFEFDYVTEVASCEIVIDDEQCTSCVIDVDTGCTVFDCKNTVDEAIAGNTCQDGFPLPLLDVINSDEFEDYPQPTCGANDGDANDGASPSHQTKSSVVAISLFAASGLFSFFMG